MNHWTSSENSLYIFKKIFVTFSHSKPSNRIIKMIRQVSGGVKGWQDSNFYLKLWLSLITKEWRNFCKLHANSKARICTAINLSQNLFSLSPNFNNIFSLSEKTSKWPSSNICVRLPVLLYVCGVLISLSSSGDVSVTKQLWELWDYNKSINYEKRNSYGLCLWSLPSLSGMVHSVSSNLVQCITRYHHANEGLLDYPPQSLDQHNEGTAASVRGGVRVGYSVW